MTLEQIRCLEFKMFNNKSFDHEFVLSIKQNNAVVVFVEIKYFLENIRIFFKMLSQKELIRLSNFKFKHLQEKYIIHRGLLRLLISKLTDIDPANIDINQAVYGKPFLNMPNLQFNLSHSENWAAYAFSSVFALGVDIEEDQGETSLNELAPLIFSAREQIYFSLRKPHEQRQLFFRLWTSKEAMSKYYGKGMFMDFKKIHLEDFELVKKTMAYGELFLFDLSKEGRYFSSLALGPHF